MYLMCVHMCVVYVFCMLMYNMLAHASRVHRLLLSVLLDGFHLISWAWSHTWAQTTHLSCSVCLLSLGTIFSSPKGLARIFAGYLPSSSQRFYSHWFNGWVIYPAPLHFFRLPANFHFHRDWLSWLVFINLTQSRITSKEGNSRKKISP